MSSKLKRLHLKNIHYLWHANCGQRASQQHRQSASDTRPTDRPTNRYPSSQRRWVVLLSTFAESENARLASAPQNHFHRCVALLPVVVVTVVCGRQSLIRHNHLLRIRREGREFFSNYPHVFLGRRAVQDAHQVDEDVILTLF